MAVGKKGMFFTLITILFIIILMFFITMKADYKLSQKTKVVGTRVNTMDNFIHDTELDMKRGLYISGFRAVLSLNEFVVSKGAYLEDTHFAFNESIMRGTINGEEMGLMNLFTFPDWIQRIQGKAQNFGLKISFSNQSIRLYQEDSWHIGIILNTTISLEDTANTALWERASSVTTMIDITNFEDPVYVVETYGRMTNPIKKTAFEGSYVSGGNVGNLAIHAENSLYAENIDAPSFLMRFEGDFSSSPYGIESMINLEELDNVGLPVYERSSVDYVYWGSEASGYRILGMPEWFRLDENHLEKYQTEDLVI